MGRRINKATIATETHARRSHQRLVRSRALKAVERTLKKMDFGKLAARVMASLIWKGRCRCKDCERIRKAGGIPYDGIPNSAKPKDS